MDHFCTRALARAETGRTQNWSSAISGSIFSVPRLSKSVFFPRPLSIKCSVLDHKKSRFSGETSEVKKEDQANETKLEKKDEEVAKKAVDKKEDIEVKASAAK